MSKITLVVVVLLMATLGVVSHQMRIAGAEIEIIEAQTNAVDARVEEAMTLAAQLPELRRAVQAQMAWTSPMNRPYGPIEVEPSAERIQLEPFVCPEVGPSRVWLPVVRNRVELARTMLRNVCAMGVRLDQIVHQVKIYKATLAAAEDTNE